MPSPKQPIQEQETLTIKPHGLYSYPNSFSAIPQGAMLEAKNVILDRPHVVEQRRGFTSYGTQLASKVKRIYSYQNTLIINYGSFLAYDSDGAGTWTPYEGGFFTPSGALTIHSISANKNTYFTSSAGLLKLDNITGPMLTAGAPAGLDGSGAVAG